MVKNDILLAFSAKVVIFTTIKYIMDNLLDILDSLILKQNNIEGYISGGKLEGAYGRDFIAPVKLKMGSMILVTEGTLTFVINGQSVSYDRGSVIHIHTWSMINGIHSSRDFKGLIVMASDELMMDISRNRNPFPPYFIYRLAKESNSLYLKENEIETIAGDISNLIRALGKTAHHYASELAYAHFYILMTDMADIVWERFGDGTPDHSSNINLPDEILKQFMTLLEDNIYNNSKVQFYADKLCISRQYLSKIVKDKTGISIGKAIATMRTKKAIRLLHDPNLSIQQIADRLSFPDQSTFGKFFKKQLGVSPLKYRKNLTKNLLTQR